MQVVSTVPSMSILAGFFHCMDSKMDTHLIYRLAYLLGIEQFLKPFGPHCQEQSKLLDRGDFLQNGTPFLMEIFLCSNQTNKLIQHYWIEYDSFHGIN